MCSYSVDCPQYISSSLGHCKTLFDTDRRVFIFIKTDGSLIDPVPFIDKFHSDIFFEYDFDGYQTIGQYIVLSEKTVMR